MFVVSGALWVSKTWLYHFFHFFIFLLLNSVYTVLPLSQGLDRVKGGTIHMKTVKYVHTKWCLSVYTEYY